MTARLTLLLSVMTGLLCTHWRAYTLGAKNERDAAQAAQTLAVRESAVAAIRQSDKTIEATHERAQNERRLAADRLATAGELDRLHRDLQAARAAASSADACTAADAARDALLEAMAADIATLAEQGAAIAAAADGHAADALMLQTIARPMPGR